LVIVGSGRVYHIRPRIKEHFFSFIHIFAAIWLSLCGLYLACPSQAVVGEFVLNWLVLHFSMVVCIDTGSFPRLGFFLSIDNRFLLVEMATCNSTVAFFFLASFLPRSRLRLLVSVLEICFTGKHKKQYVQVDYQQICQEQTLCGIILLSIPS